MTITEPFNTLNYSRGDNMTRINCVPVRSLCDKHLFAEFRELTRIPNTIQSGKAVIKDIPNSYRLGSGHVKFFYNKLGWLLNRYVQLYNELISRGYNVKFIFPLTLIKTHSTLFNNWTPNQYDIDLNLQRIYDRMPANAKITLPK